MRKAYSMKTLHEHMLASIENARQSAPLPRLVRVYQSTVLVTQMLETPLSRAVHNGHLQTARHLLDKGADVNCLDIVRCQFLPLQSRGVKLESTYEGSEYGCAPTTVASMRCCSGVAACGYVPCRMLQKLQATVTC